MSYKTLIAEMSKEMQEFGQKQPKLMGALNNMVQEASKDGVLSAKTKEFIALGIAISDRCEPCIAFHTMALVKLGMTEEELEEVLSTAIYMGGGPSLSYAMKARQAYKELSA